MASSDVGLKLGIFGFLPTTQAKTNASAIFARCAAFYTCLSLHSDRSWCRWHTHLTNHSCFDYGKTQRPQFEHHAGIKMVQVLGSPLYICEVPARWRLSVLLLRLLRWRVAEEYVLCGDLRSIGCVISDVSPCRTNMPTRWWLQEKCRRPL